MTAFRRARFIVTLLIVLMAVFVSAETAVPANASPTISLNVNMGPVGTLVQVTGSGFNAGDTSCSVAPSALITGVTPGNCGMAGGAVSFTFTVGSVSPGAYSVHVTGTPNNDVSGSVTFTVVTSTISLSPTSGPIGTTVSISGSGFNTGDAGTYPCVTSSPSPIVTAATCTFSASGAVSGSFQVAVGSTAGSYTVIVTGSTSDSAPHPFTVTTTATMISLSPSSGAAGTSVAISGSGFNPSDAGTYACVSSIPSSIFTAATCTFSASGSVSGSFKVKSAAIAGVYTVVVTGTPSGDSASAQFTVTSATISLTPNSGPTGTTVTVSGSAFNPSDAGSYSCLSSTPGSILTAISCTFSASGSMSGSFQVLTPAPLGVYSIKVTGSAGDSAVATFTVTSPSPTITLSPTFVSVGGTVSISGSGFSTSDTTTCTITSTPFGIVPVSYSCNLSAGVLSTTSFTVLSTAASGTYTITVTGSTGDSASATLSVATFLPVTFTPAAAAVGATVGVTASDTGTIPTTPTCSISGSPVTSSSCSETSVGSITGTFIVANGAAPGPYQITISTASGTTLSGVFVVQGPFIQLSDPAAVGQAASGPIGAHVSIEGAFFSLSDTTCSLSSPTNGVLILNGACSFFAGSGMFAGFNNVTGSFVVGNVPEGQYVVQVTGNTGDSAQAIFNVTAGAFIQLSGLTGGFVKVGQVASGPVGTSVSIEGSQFLPGDAFSGATCSLSSPTNGAIIVDGACSFFKAANGFVNVTGSFVVGNVPQGQYVIEVSGSAGDSAQAIFSVTAGAFIQLSGLTGGFVKVGQVASGPVGTTVSIEGSQFLPGDAFSGATCSLSSPTNGAIIVDGACSFFKAPNGFVNATGSFLVGNVLPGQYVIEVSGSAGDSAQAIFSVTLGARITLSPGTASPGGHVAVNGTGFLPTDSSCTILSPGSSAVITTSAGCAIQVGTGVIEGSFIVGNVVPGQYVIQVSGNQGDSAQAVLNVTSGPALTLTPVSGSIGTSITVHGTGFLTTDQSCSISSISTPNPILVGSAGCAITVGTGIVAGSFIIGPVSPGEYVVEVTGCSGNTGCAPSAGDFAQAVVTVTLGAPTLTLSPSSAAEGATVTFSGNGLSPSDTACSVQAFSGLVTPDSNLITASTCSITTPGIAQGTFVVGPYATSDIAWHVKVQGTPVDDVIPATAVAFTVIPDVVVTPTSGTVNTVFTFTGSGFSAAATSCTAVTVPPFGSPTCSISAGTGQVSGSVIVPTSTVSGTYGLVVTDNTGKTAAGAFTVGTPSALVVLNPASVDQDQPVGVAGFGFNPTDAYCVITSGGTPPWVGPGGVAPNCAITGGYASGSFVVSNTAPGGYYLISVIACSASPTSPTATNPCAPASTLDFASNFLGVTLATTVTTFSSTTTTSSTTTSLSTTTTSMVTSFSYSSTTYSTTGILFTTYTQLTQSTASGQTTTTITQTTSTTQTQTTVTVSTTTAYTTVPCGPLPCGYLIQPASMNLAPGIDSTGLLAALLLLIPMLLRRLFG